MLFSCSTGTKTETLEDIKSDKIVKIHDGSFAFCGASAAVPTGRKIIVQGVEYDEGCAICPVLNGSSISSLAMEGVSGTYGKFNVEKNFQTPDGTSNTVWSLFWYYDTTTTIPQLVTEHPEDMYADLVVLDDDVSWYCLAENLKLAANISSSSSYWLLKVSGASQKQLA